jgi:CRISPR-associated endonuclease/helicase Cas3
MTLFCRKEGLKLNIIAHKSKDGREQSLQEHGQNVAKMAASFAAPFGGEKFAERIGISHDAGKDTVGFQQYIQAPDKNAKSPHAIIAAALNCQANDVLSAVITAGHHSGLHNVLDTITNVRAALAERSQDIATAREYFSSDAISQTEIIPEFARKNKVFGQYAFTKMEFSCLTDADYQDTERFMRGYSPRSYDYDSFSDIYDMFRKHVQPWIDKDNEMMRRKNQPLTKDEEINHIRTQMMLQCLDAGSNSRKGDIRTLSIPTGGSKTLSSFAYAIAAAKKDTSIKRIIVVIPFNTITTQTASVLRGIVGEKNILENHSGFDFEDSKQGKLLQYASENWDIPIVVTTNVQFFESFFSNKPAKSRKLHNIADSVIIFDEVQQLPVKYLKPCIKCIESLAANFGARIVLSTATQPALEPYFETIKPREIIDDSESYVKPFRRCSIENIGTVTAKNLTERIQKHKQCLCVVNEKEEAKAIYTAIENGHCKNLYCLTTDITPYDREKLLRQIRQNLKDDEPCIVISTSLIESGVDVDFPYGYRELYGLDSILQTAGRVNRNGLRDCGSSTLFVFDGPQEEYRALRNGTSRGCNESDNKKSITRGILQKYDVDSPKAIHEYFSRLYGYKGDGLDKFDIVKMANSKLIPFQNISQKFKIIDEDTVTVIISQTAEASELVGKIRNQTATKDDIRKVGKYAVPVRRSRYDKCLAASTEVLTTKICNDVEEPDICSLIDMRLYTGIGIIFDAPAA